MGSWIIKAFISLFIFSMSFDVTYAKDARASLDRNPVQIGESVRLTIEISGSFAGQQLDPGPLRGKFEILGTSTSSQINIVNGKQESISRILIDLQPLSEGILTIPSLRFGDWSTQPIQLQVKTVQQQAGSERREIFLKASVEQKQSYVQAPINLTLQLYLAAQLIEGSLADPEVPSAELKRLGDDAQFNATVGGIKYRVIERKFAIFPQSSGILKIPPIRFQGQVSDSSQSSAFGNFFRQGRRVGARSETIEIEVLPAALDFAGDHWLPAEELSLTESWPAANQEFRVGMPLTRILRVEAKGLMGEQIPEFDMPVPEGMRSYPDKAEFSTRFENGAVIGIREQRVALVPGQAGDMKLPEITLPWWDTVQGNNQLARIAVKSLVVLPAEGGAVTSTPIQPAVEIDSRVAELSTGSNWFWISIVFAMIWLTTLVVWWLERKGRGASRVIDDEIPNAQVSMSPASIKQAALKGDCSLLIAAIQSWARIEWPGSPNMSLAEIAARLDAAEVGVWLTRLQASQYSRQTFEFDGKAFWSECKRHFVKPGNGKKSKRDKSLPGLYPHLNSQ